MARLGAFMLSSVLLGLPRVFRGVWTVALRRSRYVEQAPSDAALMEFVAALQPMIDERCHSLASGSAGYGATVVEVHGLVSQTVRVGRASAEAISVSVEGGDGVQRLVLHGRCGHRVGAARALIDLLVSDTPGPARRASSARTWARPSFTPES